MGTNLDTLRGKMLAMKNQVAEEKNHSNKDLVPSRNDDDNDSNNDTSSNIVISQELKNTQTLLKIELNKIKPNPFQPRTVFEGIESLADSIEEKGLLQPVTVIKITDDEYILIAGERRLRACKLIQERNPIRSTIDAIVREDTITNEEKELLAALENLQRSDMTIIDTANMYNNISKYSSYSEISKALGGSKTAIARYIKIASLPNEIKNILNKKEIRSTNKIELLATINGNTQAQRDLALDILNDEPIFRIESKIRKILKGVNVPSRNDDITEIILSIYEKIKPTSKLIPKATYRKLDDEKRNKVDEYLNTILEAQKQIELIKDNL
jgi:ParB family chromosome partitioning protein